MLGSSRPRSALLVALALASSTGCDCGGGGEPVRCATREPSLEAPVTVGPVTLTPDGRRLRLEGLPETSRWVVGRGPALALEPIAPALDAIEALEPDAVLVLGSLGTGPRLEELTAALAELAVPTLLVPGPRDRVEEVDEALAARAAPHVVLLAGFQVVEAGPVELVIAPGGIDPRYQPADGCSVTTGDLEDALGASSSERVRALVGFAAPSGTPLTAGLDGAEAGSDAVRAAMAEAEVEAGIFAGPDTRVAQPFVGPGPGTGPSRSLRLVVPPLLGPAVECTDGSRAGAAPTLVLLGPEGLTARP